MVTRKFSLHSGTQFSWNVHSWFHTLCILCQFSLLRKVIGTELISQAERNLAISFLTLPRNLRVHTDPSLRSLMQILNSTGPTINPWRTLAVIIFQVNSAYFPFPRENVVEESIQSLAEVNVNDIHMFPSSVHYSSHCRRLSDRYCSVHLGNGTTVTVKLDTCFLLWVTLT